MKMKRLLFIFKKLKTDKTVPKKKCFLTFLALNNYKKNELTQNILFVI